jgi:hypothetical protein
MNLEERQRKFLEEHPDHHAFNSKGRLQRVVFGVSLRSIRNLINKHNLEWVKKNHPEAYEVFKDEI